MEQLEQEQGQEQLDSEAEKRAEVVEEIITQYQNQIDDRAGKLYNRIVGYISEAQIPIQLVLTVLDLLRADAIEIARKKYFKAE